MLMLPLWRRHMSSNGFAVCESGWARLMLIEFSSPDELNDEYGAVEMKLDEKFRRFNTKSQTHSTDAPDAGIAAADAAESGHNRAAVSD